MAPMARTATLAAAAWILAGCAAGIHSGSDGRYPERNEVPIAANFPTSLQMKLQAAEHWQRVAADAAGGLAQAFPRGSTVHLRRGCETSGCAPQACDTPFNRVFFNQFLTALVGLGYHVSAAAVPNAPTVEVDIQAVTFAHDRPQYRYAGVPVRFGPGIWALRDDVSLWDRAGNEAQRTLAPDGNWYRAEFAGGPTPRGELVVTVSALSAARTYVARNTKVYYTADADVANYSCAAPAAPGARTWAIPVTGDCTAPRCVDAERRRQ